MTHSDTDLNSVILDTVASLVIAFDAAGRVVRFNRACERLTGYSRDEMHLRRLADLPFMAPEAVAPAQQCVAGLMNGEATAECEGDLLTRDGRRRRVAWSNAAVRSGAGGAGPVEYVIATGVDVTDRRAAEDQLRASHAEAQRANESLRISESRLRRIFESNMVGFIHFDLDGRITAANDEFLRIVGYTRDDLEQGRIRWSEITPPEFRHLDERGVRELLATGTCQPFEKEYVHKDGSRVPILIGATSVVGSTREGISFVVDQRERRKAEAARRDAQERLRLAMTAANMVGWDWEPATGHVERFGSIEPFYGMSAPSADDFIRLIHPDDAPRLHDVVERFMAGADPGPLKTEFRMVRPDGQVRWVRDVCTVQPGPDGRPRRLMGVSVDVTERKKTEQELLAAYETLRESEERLRLIVENSPDVTFCQDRDLRMQWIAKTTPPLTKADVIGKTDFDYTDEAEARRLTEIKQRVMQTGAGERTDSSIVIDGVRRHYEVALEPWRDRDGRIQGVAGYCRDITERLRAERALRALNETLEQRVADRTADLMRVNEQLHRSEAHYRELAERNRLLAQEVEHRVRNNLHALTGLVTLMTERAADVPSFSRAIHSRLAAMAHIHDLLADTDWAGVGLRKLVESILETMGHLARHPAHTSVDGPDLPLRPRHALPLTMILVELFTNSCKYGSHSAPGGELRIGWDVTPGPAPCPERVGTAGNGSAKADAGERHPGGGPDANAPETSTVLVRLSWTERGGPPVRGPVQPSLGTELVESFVRRELRGRCRLSFPPEGAEHVIEFSAETTPARGNESVPSETTLR